MSKAVNIISSKGGILRALLDSKINASVIGIHSKKLGTATFLTGVQEILLPAKDEPMVVLAGFDITGYVLPQNIIRLSEIGSVIPFVSRFEHPFLKDQCKLLSSRVN